MLTTLWHERYFETRCKQWVNQATIERQTLLDAPVPLPPLPEQRRIVARIEALLRQSRTAREALQAAWRRLDELEQAILASAFQGELVAQDTKDEPAAALLERVRREREASATENERPPRRARLQCPRPG